MTAYTLCPHLSQMVFNLPVPPSDPWHLPLTMGLTMGLALALTRKRPGAYEPGAHLRRGVV